MSVQKVLSIISLGLIVGATAFTAFPSQAKADTESTSCSFYSSQWNVCNHHYYDFSRGMWVTDVYFVPRDGLYDHIDPLP